MVRFAFKAVNSMGHCGKLVTMETKPSSVSEVKARIDALEPEAAGKLWLRLKQDEAVLNVKLEALKARARREPFSTSFGKVLKELKCNRRDFNKEAAVKLLQARGATLAEIEACYVTSEVSQVRELKDKE